jgi:HSP20 family protein
MTESERTPTRRFLDLEREVEEAFGSLIDEPWGRRTRPEWVPAVDVDETRDAYIVTVDVPGVPADDIELRVRPREVEIRGTRTSSRSIATAARIHTERVSGGFHRTFRLDDPVDPQSAKCEYKDGVYEVRVRKLHQGNEHDDAWEDETR